MTSQAEIQERDRTSEAMAMVESPLTPPQALAAAADARSGRTRSPLAATNPNPTGLVMAPESFSLDTTTSMPYLVPDRDSDELPRVRATSRRAPGDAEHSLNDPDAAVMIVMNDDVVQTAGMQWIEGSTWASAVQPINLGAVSAAAAAGGAAGASSAKSRRISGVLQAAAPLPQPLSEIGPGDHDDSDSDPVPQPVRLGEHGGLSTMRRAPARRPLPTEWTDPTLRRRASSGAARAEASHADDRADAAAAGPSEDAEPAPWTSGQSAFNAASEEDVDPSSLVSYAEGQVHLRVKTGSMSGLGATAVRSASDGDSAGRASKRNSAALQAGSPTTPSGSAAATAGRPASVAGSAGAASLASDGGSHGSGSSGAAGGPRATVGLPPSDEAGPNGLMEQIDMVRARLAFPPRAFERRWR